MHLHALAAGFVFVTLAAGCGGQTAVISDAGSSDAGVASAACTDLAAARCQRLATCASTYVAKVYGTEPACESIEASLCTAHLAVPGNADSAAHVEGCAAAFAGWACADLIRDANIPAACAQVTGSGAVGAPCSVDGQCATGFCAFGTSACGSCAAAPTNGEPCTPLHQCAPGLGCTPDRICAPPGGPGAACSGDASCGDGLHCGSDGTCTAWKTTVGAGGSCGTLGGANVGCASSTCEKGTCVARAATGASCDENDGPFCQPGASCIAGTCQVPMCP